MPDDTPRIRRISRMRPALAAAAVLLGGAVVAAPLAAGATTSQEPDRQISFQPSTTAPGALPINLGATTPPKQGVSGKVKFRTNKADRRALSAARTQQQLRDDAERNLDASTKAGQRIAAIEQLLSEVEGDEQRLRAAIQRRAVERYKQGDAGDVTFLLTGGGFSDILGRSKVLRDQSERDRRTIEEYELTVAKIDQYRRVLEQLRDLTGEQSQRLNDRANRLDDVLVAAKAGHDEAPDVDPAKQSKGVGGSWYIMDGAFSAQLYLPAMGGSYGGGTRTPARQATADQIQRALSDPRIVFTASGYQDVATGQIDGRVLDAIIAAAAQFNHIRITSLKRDHGVYTASGNVSAHSYGCAVDIGTIGSTFITPSSQVPGGEVDLAVRFFAGLQGDLAPHQVISLFSYGGPTLAMGDHGDHIHVGYSC